MSNQLRLGCANRRLEGGRSLKMADGLLGQLAGHIGRDAHRLLDDDLNVCASSMAPTAEELAKSYVAPGLPAQLHTCIAYHAYWKNENDGMARHARQQIKALAMTGLPLRVQSLGERVFMNEELAPGVKEILYLEGVSSRHTAISIKQMILDRPILLRECLCPVGIRNSMSTEAVARILESTIMYTSWERDRVHPDYIRELKQLGQVWVPCVENKKAFVDSGLDPDKVKIVPCPYNPEEHTIAAPRGVEDVPNGKRFYNIGKWEPRKNQHRLIGAFLLAFTPKSNASLFIKTSEFGISWGNYPKFTESLEFWLEQDAVKANGWTAEHIDRLVRVVDKRLTNEDMEKIHKTNNIYVSAGLGEAWDLPAFDAKMAGNRLVYVGYGGPSGYAESSDVVVEWDSMTDVHPFYGWEPGAKWADVSAAQLADAMKKAVPPLARLVPQSYCRQYGLLSVGLIMEGYIQELAKKLGCWEQLQKGGFG